MKRNKLFTYIFLLFLFLSSCKENEIEFYNQTTRINFKTPSVFYTFRDVDYLKNNTISDVEVEFQLQGLLLKSPKDFVIKEKLDEDNKNKAEVIVESKYTFSNLDVNYQKVNIKVKMPKKPSKEYCKTTLEFDINNSEHQFEPGRVDMSTCEVNVGYKLLTSTNIWSIITWGEYSDAKYFFMIDHFKAVYKDIPTDKESILGLINKYEEYKKTNGPILDDEGKEIVFPKP